VTAPLTLYLMRHGDVHNPDKVLYGRLPGYRLSAKGRTQAQAAADHLRPIALNALYASPMERAQETAQIIASEQAQIERVITAADINECYTPFDGTPHAELDKIKFDLYTGTDAQYEKPRDLRQRFVRFVQMLRQTYPNGTVGAVSHGDIVVTAFMWAMGQGANDIGRTRTSQSLTRLLELGLPEPYPATASISALTFTSDNPDERPDYTYIKPYA
jgi:broad specificity phosphatase PhoE